MSTAPFEPCRPGERLAALDTLRGFALLGILVPNIVAFAHPMASMSDPAVIGPGWWNRFAHDLTSTVFLGKFMFLFAMLFGAGVVMFDRKTAPADRPPRLRDGAWLWHRRCVVLLSIGLVHAYLFWYGDVLTWYAIAGLTLVWWVRRLSPKVQIALGLGLYGLGAAIMAGLTLLAIAAVNAGTMPASELMGGDPALETAGYLGSWVDVFSTRLGQTLMMHLVMGPLFLPGLWGMMTLGMGLTRLGILTGERGLRFHQRLGLVLTVVGGAITGGAYVWMHHSAAYPGVLWQVVAQLIGIPLAIGYSQLVIALALSRRGKAVAQALANVGRLALSNYLLHTLCFTTLMYGYAGGRFGTVEYPMLFVLVGLMWALNLALSAAWLRKFRFGPVERLWRQGTYRGVNRGG